MGSIMGLLRGDTRSLDYSSHEISFVIMMLWPISLA